MTIIMFTFFRISNNLFTMLFAWSPNVKDCLTISHTKFNSIYIHPHPAPFKDK